MFTSGQLQALPSMLKSSLVSLAIALGLIALAFASMFSGLLPVVGKALLWPGFNLWRPTVDWVTTTQGGSKYWAYCCYLMPWWVMAFVALEIRRGNRS